MLWKTQIDALFESCKKGDLDIKSMKPSDVASLRDANGQSLLDVAILSKHRELIAALIVPVGAGVDGRDSLQRALSCAAQTGDVKHFKDVHKRILEAIKGISTADEKTVCSRALSEACARGAADVVHVILDGNAEHSLDKPLLEAWVHGHLGIVDMLIDAGANAHQDITGKFTVKVLRRSHRLLGDSMDERTRRKLINHLTARGAGVPEFEYDDEDEDLGYDDDVHPVGYWTTVGKYGTEELIRYSVLSVGDEDGQEDSVIKALCGACDSDNVEVFKYLLAVAESRGYAVYAEALFNYSLRKGSKDVLEHIVAETSVDISHPGHSYNRLDMKQKLALAAGCGSVAVIRKILDSTDLSINCVSMDSWTPLSCASDPATIRFLLDAKADVNPKGCDTVLRGACRKLQPDAVKMLLAAGADVNRIGADAESSALSFAVYAVCPNDRVGDKIEIINMLFDAGADTRNCDKGRSVLHLPLLIEEASYNLEAAFTAVLARDPGLVHCRDAKGNTPQLLVAKNHLLSPALMKVLIDAKADVDAIDNEHNTACSLPFRFYSDTTAENEATMRRCLQLLLAAGADPTQCNGEGKTLLMQMVSMGEDAYGDWHGLPESGFHSAPAVLADVINAVAYRNTGSRSNYPDARAVEEDVRPVKKAKRGRGSNARVRTTSGAGVDVLEAIDKPRKRSRRK
jgi:ankyrin repeat protein